jgi:hypothetical protein
MLDAAGSERGVWAIDACEALKLAVLGEREAAWVQSCWRCSSERCALLVQKVCLACSSCWKSVWLSNMVAAMVRRRRRRGAACEDGSAAVLRSASVCRNVRWQMGSLRRRGGCRRARRSVVEERVEGDDGLLAPPGRVGGRGHRGRCAGSNAKDWPAHRGGRTPGPARKGQPR